MIKIIVKICKLSSDAQQFRWSIIIKVRRRKADENKDKMKERKEEVAIWDKKESKYFEKLLIQLSE